jgi:hypothetical protein
LDYSRLLARVREVDSVALKAAHELIGLASTPGGIVLIRLLKLRAETGLNKESFQSIAAA